MVYLAIFVSFLSAFSLFLPNFIACWGGSFPSKPGFPVSDPAMHPAESAPSPPSPNYLLKNLKKHCISETGISKAERLNIPSKPGIKIWCMCELRFSLKCITVYVICFAHFTPIGRCRPDPKEEERIWQHQLSPKCRSFPSPDMTA